MDESLRHRGTLGIVGDTDAEDIRRRYRRQMLLHHPDRAPRGREQESLRRSQEINAARTWLLAHPEAWTIAAPSPRVEAPSSRVESHYSAYAPAPVESARSSDGASWVLVAVGIYFGVLLFAIVGYVACLLLGI